MSDKIASITIMILNTIPASLMPNPSSNSPTPTTGIEMAIYAMVKKVDVISACLYSGATAFTVDNPARKLNACPNPEIIAQ